MVSVSAGRGGRTDDRQAARETGSGHDKLVSIPHSLSLPTSVGVFFTITMVTWCKCLLQPKSQDQTLTENGLSVSHFQWIPMMVLFLNSVTSKGSWLFCCSWSQSVVVVVIRNFLQHAAVSSTYTPNAYFLTLFPSLIYSLILAVRIVPHGSTIFSHISVRPWRFERSW